MTTIYSTNYNKKVLFTGEPFILGYCKCGCNEEIRIRSGHYLRRFKYKHNMRGINHPNYRGGKRRTSHKYVEIYSPDHPNKNKRNCVYEHRLRMEEYLGRYLRPEEEVHHLDGLTINNRMGNLMYFVNRAEHRRYEMTGNQRSKKDMSSRYCLLCGGKTGIKKNGCEDWHKYQNEFICDKCYKRVRKNKGL